MAMYLHVLTYLLTYVRYQIFSLPFLPANTMI